MRNNADPQPDITQRIGDPRTLVINALASSNPPSDLQEPYENGKSVKAEEDEEQDNNKMNKATQAKLT